MPGYLGSLDGWINNADGWIATRTAALPGTGILTVQGSILKSWAVHLRLARPFTNRVTGQVISPQLIANQQSITESFQEILSGQEATEEFSIQSLRVKGRGNGQTVSDLPYAASTWLDSLNKLTARPLQIERPMTLAMTPVSFGSVSKSYGQ
ncbi:hypothetical protein H7R52_12030 [Weissella confusa]|uniref:Uncharacterized protein n=1 Tax=Weissella confusa TaxID=1583 RepID=A0A923NEX0_WEICO|nr:hypothetical protein [Weissella confusa]